MTAVERAILSREQARAVVDRIKVGAEAVGVDYVDAYLGQAWVNLGYGSWDDLCSREFDHLRLRLPREERQEVVASMRSTGLSIRAIASATGLATNTVMGSLREAGDQVSQTETPGPGDREADDWFADFRSPAPSSPDDDPAPQPPKVTGMDGKQYPPKGTPRVSSRAPLPAFALRTGVDLRRLVERLERIATDDRLDPNREQIGIHLRSHLAHAIDVCSGLLDQLNQEKPQ